MEEKYPHLLSGSGNAAFDQRIFSRLDEAEQKEADILDGLRTAVTLVKAKYEEIQFHFDSFSGYNGCGMSEKVRNQILEPFFTTKDVGSGTGLGLSTSHGIIEKHQGEISIDSTEGKGTTVSVLISL